MRGSSPASENLRGRGVAIPFNSLGRWPQAKVVFYGMLALTGLVFALRIYFSLCVPAETSDAYRNLGYSSALGEYGYGLYGSRALDFPQEAWAKAWPTVVFIYPPVTLCFFYMVSHLGLGLFFAKLLLTLLDFLSSLMISREISPLAGLLFFAMPLHVWFGSHEGQFEPLLAFFLCLSIFLTHRKSHLWSGLAWGFALQTKHFALLLAPWLLGKLWLSGHDARGRGKNTVLFGLGVMLSILPFLGFYAQSLAPFLAALRTQHMHFNPFSWLAFTHGQVAWVPARIVIWDDIATSLILVLSPILAMRALGLRKGLFATLPLLAFWVLMKSLAWGQFWYLMAASPFVLCLAENKRLATLILCLFALQDLRSIEQILGVPTEQIESLPMRQAMEKSQFFFTPSSK